MARFDLSQIETPKDDTPAISIALPQGGAYLLQCALTEMDKRWQWTDETDPLTDNQWDDLQEELAALMLAIMTEVTVSGETIGTITAFQMSPGTDWIECKGGLFDYVDYPLMEGKVATAFQEDEDSFRTPDLRGGFIRGEGSGGQVPIGEEGGEARVELTESQMPAHVHEMRTIASGGTSGSTNYIVSGSATKQPRDTRSTGLGETHENLPPYVALAFYMKAR